MIYVRNLRKTLFNHVFFNSLWGLFSNIFQNIVYAIFFVVLARTYDTHTLTSYILANTLYGLFLSFSSLGLGQAYIKELINQPLQSLQINTFFAVQISSGILFLIFQLIMSFILYDQKTIHILSILFGINIILDNVIYVFKTLNTLYNNQKQTFLVTSFEAFLKLMLTFLVFKFIPDIKFVVFVLILLRFTSFILFLNSGTQAYVKFTITEIFINLKFNKVSDILISNKYFIIIGSLSVLYWSFGNIFVSKILGLDFVPNFEIAYKLFSMAEMVPLIFSATIYPILIKKYNSSKNDLIIYFRNIFKMYLLYGLFSFLVVYFYAPVFIPLFFGNQLYSAGITCREMFFTMLIFPTSLLQANLIIAIGGEKKDMLFNIYLLLLYVSLCGILFIFYKSLTLINVSIFVSFLVFHLLQDIYLLKLGYIKKTDVLLFYVYLFLCLFIIYIFEFIKYSN